ncbi:hypothetical protein K469DRAFT_400124 [Zopfia rhizophila CBS 207.26]|uniref:Secreted protein n=1 Tax=Zopfia rhizophila CBS 207.26 TaxID=1314779 RepID=A0A6A6DC38_9PEZI|nr:hypothetical protein K469DRAFT_400124 [Zopfia rhizophila CBS 207.26]
MPQQRLLLLHSFLLSPLLTRSSPFTPPLSLNDPSCSSEDLFPNTSGNGHTFVECVMSSEGQIMLIHRRCPDGLYWNKRSLAATMQRSEHSRSRRLATIWVMKTRFTCL